MTLFVQSDSGGDGTGTVFPNNAEADLFAISNQDMALGETTQPAPSDLIQVTYGNQNQHGPCPDRLHTLVNQNFNAVPGDPVDIIILAVNSSFTLNDGTSMANNGTSLPWSGSGLPGAGNNPTNKVLVIYDAFGCIREKGQVSQQYDLASPSPVTLYHELSHAFRFATSASLSLVGPGPGVCPASPEEHAAEVDENDMRTQMGVPLRDATDHCGNPCNGPSPSCCIVASIATGSYSVELNALRQLRDGFLRRSDVGFDFFEHLHYDYYSFSPEVCRAMAGDPELVTNIAAYYVRPLTACLSLANARLLERVAPSELGERFLASITPELGDVDEQIVRDAVAFLTARVHPLKPGPHLPLTPPAASDSAYVRWALVEPITIYLATLIEQKQGLPAARLGKALAGRFDRWASSLPITPVWSEFSEYEFAEELSFLAESLLRSRPARRRFAARLLREHNDEDRVQRLLIDSRYLEREV